LTYKIPVFVERGVSTIELWTLGMVWEGAGGIGLSQKKEIPSIAA
jgi:hypothetical protein